MSINHILICVTLKGRCHLLFTIIWTINLWIMTHFGRLAQLLTFHPPCHSNRSTDSALNGTLSICTLPDDIQLLILEGGSLKRNALLKDEVALRSLQAQTFAKLFRECPDHDGCLSALWCIDLCGVIYINHSVHWWNKVIAIDPQEIINWKSTSLTNWNMVSLKRGQMHNISRNRKVELRILYSK